LLALQSQVAFTAVFALLVFRDVPTFRRIGGMLICFTGLTIIGIQYAGDRAGLPGMAGPVAGSYWGRAEQSSIATAALVQDASVPTKDPLPAGHGEHRHAQARHRYKKSRAQEKPGTRKARTHA